MLELRQLSKRYGTFTALEDVTLQVAGGQVFGLLGPNGAGKTTLLRILATLLQPSSGSAQVAGLDVAAQPDGVRQLIGVVNGGMGLPARLTGREILHSFAGFYGLSRAQAEARIAELDAALDLGRTLDTRAGEYSTGMRQKVTIARAVIQDPAVLILDEAASGLDIFARRALLDWVAAARRPGKLTLYSTHVMSEVEEVCDRVAVLHAGRLLAEGTQPELLAHTRAASLEEAFFRLVELDEAAHPQDTAHAS
ncbi:ATP-binding cassette domain-containing protein [Deinococcus sp. Marseille-Q6407]|uniref:ABC transporter ATP-binding protein n=1 Tax=Deinococcus sp. Marseille-Q6407 TaxID=2969223 RepID=UPI0021BE0D44|nr:ATP-binding cassette domain-containing protein [Deinococcus sp. Marseille-Q6407]